MVDTLIDDMALGHIFQDNLYLTSEVNVSNQTMLLIMKEIIDNESDGVIGLGLEEILSNNSKSLLTNLQQQGIIRHKIFAFYLSNSIYSSSISSELSFGDYNSNLISGTLKYFALCSNQSWGFNASNFSFDATIIENNTRRTLLNSAASAISAPFQSYVTILSYLKSNFESCLSFGNIIKCSCPSGSSSFPTFSFVIEDTQFKLEPKYYITEENSICSLKITSGDSIEEIWILGMDFLQKYYAVFDAEELKIGLAESVKADLEIDLIYEDTIVVGVILFVGFFVGLAIIWMVEKVSGWKDLDNKTENFEFR